MANKGSSLATGAYLATNDYLVSANGLYFAIMQSDGNLVVTTGTGVADGPVECAAAVPKLAANGRPSEPDPCG